MITFWWCSRFQRGFKLVFQWSKLRSLTGNGFDYKATYCFVTSHHCSPSLSIYIQYIYIERDYATGVNCNMWGNALLIAIYAAGALACPPRGRRHQVGHMVQRDEFSLHIHYKHMQSSASSHFHNLFTFIQVQMWPFGSVEHKQNDSFKAASTLWTSCRLIITMLRLSEPFKLNDLSLSTETSFFFF